MAPVLLRRKTNIITGAVALAIVIALLLESFRISHSNSVSDPGPAAYPQFVLILMAICAVGIMLTPEAKRSDKESSPRDWKIVAVILAVIAVYTTLLVAIGYLVATAIFAVVLAFLAGERRWWILAIYGVVIPTVLYVGFSVYLSISLPMGPWEELIS